MKRILYFLAPVLAMSTRALLAQGYVVVHDLVATDGSYPASTLVQDSDGFFYGTTQETVFKVDAGNNFQVLHVFDTPGVQDVGGLVLGEDGLLYGLTYGGTHGEIYRLDRNGNSFSVLHDLDGANDGAVGQEASLVQAPDTTLYGVASLLGPSGYGTVFKIDTAGTSFEVVHAFGDAANDGRRPEKSLLLASDGRLYGITTLDHDGAFGGTVFGLDVTGAHFQTLHTFTDDMDGTDPYGALIEGSDGFLYGTTRAGGENHFGTAFKLRKDGTSYAVIHAFSTEQGIAPWASLTQVVGGLLYGTTSNAATNGGTIFRMRKSGELFDVVHEFAQASGNYTKAAVMQGLDGQLYGTTVVGGSGFGGVVYRQSIPRIASMDPASGPASGGAVAVLSGSGFEAGATVTIGDALTGAVIEPSEITVNTPPLSAGTLNDVLVSNPDSTVALYENAWLADFLDVPAADPFHAFIEAIVRRGITAGCGGGKYCRDDAVTRAQMAVFLLKAEHGRDYLPPSCAGVFPDVACPSPFADWIEQLAAEGITGGCGGGQYCPGNPVTRAQMAVFLLKAEHGSAYVPPACSGIFDDVACPSPFADWIERLAAESVTGGCGGGNYCPQSANTRGQMAVFLTKAFHFL